MPITALNASTAYYFTGDGYADAGVLLRCCCGAVSVRVTQSEVGSEDWLRLARACRDGAAASAGMRPSAHIAVENGIVKFSAGISVCDTTSASAIAFRLPAAVCQRAFSDAHHHMSAQACEGAKRAFAAGLKQVPAPSANL